MKQEFEFRPFDRVTIDFVVESVSAVLFEVSGTLVAGSYADPYGLNNFNTYTDKIRPGHYDADGNWLPYPGEPCYHINTDGEPVQTMVFSVIGEIITVLDRVALYRNFYKLFGAKAVETHFFNGEDFGHDIPQSALLFPGRIKTSQQ